MRLWLVVALMYGGLYPTIYSMYIYMYSVIYSSFVLCL